MTKTELSDKQQAFVDEYCINGHNASKAYHKAYPASSDKACESNGIRQIRKDKIKQAIAVKIANRQAKADYDYKKACSALDSLLTNLSTLVKAKNVQAIQAATAILREKNNITGLHSITNINRDMPEPKPMSDDERAELQRLAGIDILRTG